MANITYGKPLITGTVMRADSPSRPTAREPSLHAAPGFPIMVGHCMPGPGPRPIHPSPVRCRRKRATKRRGRTDHSAPPILSATLSSSDTPRTVRYRRGRRITEAAFIARARFNTGLTP